MMTTLLGRGMTLCYTLHNGVGNARPLDQAMTTSTTVSLVQSIAVHKPSVNCQGYPLSV